MTPAARYAAAIDVLDRIIGGEASEPALAGWARQNRYAGSKDRSAIRDHVFDVLRRKRSCAAWGGGETGRALILGLLRQDGVDPATVFGAGGYGPDPLATEEAEWTDAPDLAPDVACDLPAWLWPIWQEDLGDAAADIALAQRDRAGVFLRVAMRKGDRTAAQAALAEDGVTSEPHPDVPTSLIVTGNPRRVAQSRAYAEGLVEVQDAASQAAMLALAPVTGTVLDYCAGGGGKALALADQNDVALTAHDIAAQRMADIPARAARAGVTITTAERAALRSGGYDLVLCDAPCSGSGTWRRTPQAKWALTPERLAELQKIQAEVLDAGAAFVAPGGRLAYATCSVLARENTNIVNDFCTANPGWRVERTMNWWPQPRNDGFFLAILIRA